MSDNKKYYYMRLVDNFYDRPEIKLIEKIENGYQYVAILLKMYLRSLKHDGALTFSDGIPYDIQMLSSVIGHDMVMIEKAIEIFQKYKLVEIMDDGTIYMTKIQNFIGESSTEADRKRRFRARIDTHAGQLSDNRPPELEIEFKDKDRDRDKDSSDGVPSLPLQKNIQKDDLNNKDNAKPIINKENTHPAQKPRPRNEVYDHFVMLYCKKFGVDKMPSPGSGPFIRLVALGKEYDVETMKRMFDAYFCNDLGKKNNYVINCAISDYAIQILYPLACKKVNDQNDARNRREE
jgi:predicted phage replisome organizer